MKVKLIEAKEVNDFPAGSGIEILEEKVYLVGNNSKDILILDKNWKQMESVPLFNDATQHLPVRENTDLEATALVEVNSIPRLMILSSGINGTHRNKLLLVNLDDHSHEETDIAVFYDRLKEQLDHISIESASVVLGKLVLGNRGQNNTPDNTMVVTEMNFWKNQQESEIRTVQFDLPDMNGKTAGITGLSYSPVNDWLVASMSSWQSGEISDSYLAIIENASRKVVRKKMKVNTLINLNEAHDAFRGFRITSVCIQSEKNGKVKLQLAADGDNGNSQLFRLRIKEY